jgi:4-hydroxybenzoate polyprenyltransferase
VNGRGGPAARVVGKSALFARMIKVEHSVYALPFAYAGAFLALMRAPSWRQIVWITVAMVGARSAAMALNRLIDAELDARNPRTAGRELPAGRLRRREVIAFTIVSLVLLVLAAFNLAHVCRYLWPIPVAAFVAYPYAKRVTALCHYVLGLTDGLAPAAAWVAVTGKVSWVPVLLFVAVGLWVGGFDVIYGGFDVEFDRAEGIHSIAVAVGESAAIWIAALSHLVALALLVAVGGALHVAWVYYAGCALVGGLLAWSDADVGRRGLERVGMRFMTVNGIVGIVYGAVAIAAALLA